MKIGGFQKFSMIDYPGKLSAIIFTQGCNFRCPYCHNMELVEPGLFNEPYSENVIFDFLKQRKGKLDAVTITGGEPTLHKDLFDFALELKKLGFLVKLDTNGTNPQVLEKMLYHKLIDFAAMDLKAPLDKYSNISLSKVDLDKIKQSVEVILKSRVDYEFRTTIMEELFSVEDFLQIIEDFGPFNNYSVQKYKPIEKNNEHLGRFRKPSTRFVKSVEDSISKTITNLKIR